MVWFYDFVFLVFALVSIPKFLVRLKQTNDQKRLLRERFGFLPEALKEKCDGKQVIWLHAVSVGEVMAARSWIELFSQKYPDWVIALSVTTPTGHSVAQSLTFDQLVVFYAPFDLSGVVRRAIVAIRPRLILLMETEIWPNLILGAVRARIPVGIINGRISPRSFRRYQLVQPVVASLLKRLSFCSVQSERDQKYFLELGMPSSKMICTGNMKFDFLKKVESFASGEGFFQNLKSEKGLVLVGGSTHWNEEELLLHVFRQLLENFTGLKLVLAPRHPEQARRVATAIEQNKLRYQLSSQNRSDGSYDVLLVDQIGILVSLYSLADVVFMGGSFVCRGGQNPIEAAFCEKPILHGPNVFNFHEVYRALDERGAAFQVDSEEELFQKLSLLFSNSGVRKQMGLEAASIVQSMQGATMRTLEFLSSWIHDYTPSVPLSVVS